MQPIQFIFGHVENINIMKPREIIVEYTNLLTDEKKVEIRENISKHWDDFYTADELATYIENGYIFGTFANDEHFLHSDILQLVSEVEAEKNPPIVVPEEPVVPLEEPVVEPIIPE